MSAWLLRVSLACLLLGACADPDVEVKIPTPDVPSFESTVYPILLRDCGFPACHGDTRRFFRVFGPGRTRYRPRDVTPLLSPPTTEELTASYQRARSMLANEGNVEESPLLQKPLIDGHEGHDEWGRNVYWSRNDPNYQALLNWARSVRPSMPDAGGAPPVSTLPDAGGAPPLGPLPDAGGAPPVSTLPDAAAGMLQDAGVGP